MAEKYAANATINGKTWSVDTRISDEHDIVITIGFMTHDMAEKMAVEMDLIPEPETNEQRLLRELAEAHAEIARLLTLPSVKEWQEGKTYQVGDRVTVKGQLMEAKLECHPTGGYDEGWKNHSFCWKEVI
jgi:hypothetical protein